MPMTPLTGLDRTSATFRTDLDTFFLSKLPTFVTEANALELAADADRVAAAASAVSAQQQVTLAADQVTLASSQASSSSASASASQSFAGISAANANFKGSWSTLTGALSMPASVLHQGKYWLLLANLANVTTDTPGVSASWSLISTGGGNADLSAIAILNFLG